MTSDLVHRDPESSHPPWASSGEEAIPLQGSQLAGKPPGKADRVGPSQETTSRRKSGDLGGSWFRLEFSGCLGGSVQAGEVS